MLDGKVIVITGASDGIGACTAEEIVRRGGKAVLVARRQDALDAVATRLGGESLPVAADVTRRADLERVASEAIARFGAVDVWISNAGRAISKPAVELTDDEIDQIMTVNFKSALWGLQAILPHFRARGRGHAIHISSLLGRMPFATIRSAYAASKAALNVLSAALRVDLRPENILVSTVHVGPVATDFGKNALGGGIDNRQLPGAQSPEEVARVIADLVEQPRAEVYTRPEYRQRIARYYAADDVAELEREFLPSRR